MRLLSYPAGALTAPRRMGGGRFAQPFPGKLGARFSPLILPGLTQWLDASVVSGSGGIATWSDLSGNGNDATQATTSRRMTLVSAGRNGLNVLRADGVDDNYGHAIDLIPTFTVFVALVARASYSGYRGVYSAGAGTGQGLMMLGNLSTANKWGAFSGSGEHPSGTQLSNGSAYILTMSGNYNTGGSLKTNGVPDGTWPSSAPQAGNPIGGLTGGQEIAADFLEVILCNQVLSDADVASAHSYLSAKWAI